MGYEYVPIGGWYNFETSFDHIENCFEYIAKNEQFDWWQIVDTNIGKIIHSS
jgi:hypothetical protein